MYQGILGRKISFEQQLVLVILQTNELCQKNVWSYFVYKLLKEPEVISRPQNICIDYTHNSKGPHLWLCKGGAARMRSGLNRGATVDYNIRRPPGLYPPPPPGYSPPHPLQLVRGSLVWERPHTANQNADMRQKPADMRQNPPDMRQNPPDMRHKSAGDFGH